MKLGRLLLIGIVALLLGALASYFATRSHLWVHVIANSWLVTAISALAALSAAVAQVRQTRSTLRQTEIHRMQASKELDLARAMILKSAHHGHSTSARDSTEDEWLRLIAKTSNANVGASGLDTDQSLAELRSQLATLTRQVQEHKNEIVEVHKVDPVLEATLRVSIENLTKRIETLERRQLEKWDVALVFIQLLGAIGVFFGIVFGILKYVYGK